MYGYMALDKSTSKTAKAAKAASKVVAEGQTSVTKTKVTKKSPAKALSAEKKATTPAKKVTSAKKMGTTPKTDVMVLKKTKSDKRIVSKSPAAATPAPKAEIVAAKTVPPKKNTVSSAPAPIKSAPQAPRIVPRATLSALFGEDISSKPRFSLPPPSWVRPEWRSCYIHLYELWSRLKNQMTFLTEDSQQKVTCSGDHMADTGTDHFDRDFALSLLSADQDAIFEVEQALDRIHRGTYGICEQTGRPIPLARLEAVPWTRYTVEAQAQLEKEGILKRKRRLGDFRMVEDALDDESATKDGEEEDEREQNE